MLEVKYLPNGAEQEAWYPVLLIEVSSESEMHMLINVVEILSRNSNISFEISWNTSQISLKNISKFSLTSKQWANILLKKKFLKSFEIVLDKAYWVYIHNLLLWLMNSKHACHQYIEELDKNNKFKEDATIIVNRAY